MNFYPRSHQTVLKNLPIFQLQFLLIRRCSLNFLRRTDLPCLFDRLLEGPRCEIGSIILDVAHIRQDSLLRKLLVASKSLKKEEEKCLEKRTKRLYGDVAISKNTAYMGIIENFFSWQTKLISYTSCTRGP